MLHLTNSEVHIIMGNTHAIAKKSTFIKKHPTLHIQNYAGNSYSAAGYKKTGYNSGKSASLNELRGEILYKGARQRHHSFYRNDHGAYRRFPSAYKSRGAA